MCIRDSPTRESLTSLELEQTKLVIRYLQFYANFVDRQTEVVRSVLALRCLYPALVRFMCCNLVVCSLHKELGRVSSLHDMSCRRGFSVDTLRTHLQELKAAMAWKVAAVGMKPFPDDELPLSDSHS